MKTAPGSPKQYKEILGREREIAKLWQSLEKGSVVFTAERRVGKSCVLEKMARLPEEGRYAVIKSDVESCRHPAELVGRIYNQAADHAILSRSAKWLGKFRNAYDTLAGLKVDGWGLPVVQSGWKDLLRLLIKDIAENCDRQIIIILDEFPHMIGNLIQDGKAAIAQELLDTLRELRMSYQANGRFRFLIAGSIGLHLVVDELKQHHGYKGNPTNDMMTETLKGMYDDDISLLCQKYLDDEGIVRQDSDRFDRHMRNVTDGIPIYVEHICDKFQAAKVKSVSITDIDRRMRELLDDPAVDWFWDAAKRIETHYSRLKADRIAIEILKQLCQRRTWVSEQDVISNIRSQLIVEYDEQVLRVLELLRRDHYIDRDIRKGKRFYRFYYEIMRRWWRLNKG